MLKLVYTARMRDSPSPTRVLPKVAQLALGIALPLSVSIGWVGVALHAGFPLFGPATAEQREWTGAGHALGVIGYATVAICAVLGWRRYPLFARTAAVVGGACFLIQLIDWVY